MFIASNDTWVSVYHYVNFWLSFLSLISMISNMWIVLGWRELWRLRRRSEVILWRICPLINYRKLTGYPLETAVHLVITLHFRYSQWVTWASISLIFRETCKALWEALWTELVAPPTEETFACIEWVFWELWHFPSCMYAVNKRFFKSHKQPRIVSSPIPGFYNSIFVLSW